MPVEEELVRPDQKRTGTARGIKDAEFRNIAGRLVLDEFADRVLHDVFHDILRRVENTARLLYFGLVLHLCLVPVREPDHFPEELLVDVTEDCGRDDREQVRRLWIVEPFDDPFEHLVVNRHRERESIGQFVRVLLLLEVEEPGVVFLIRVPEDIAEPGIGVLAFEQFVERRVLFNPPVLADAQEEDAGRLCAARHC